MTTVGLLQERPPFVTFENVEFEDREASLEAGYYVPKNIPHAVITPAGGRDNTKKPADEWIKSLKIGAMEGRNPQAWYDHFKAAYEAWKEGNELPEFGTPILTFLPFTPAQRQQLINANVRTLEDCAAMNEETMSRVGMGARELRDKAAKALESSNKLLAENEVLKVKLDQQAEELEALKQQNKMLAAESQEKKRGRPKLEEIE